MWTVHVWYIIGIDSREMVRSSDSDSESDTIYLIQHIYIISFAVL